MNKLITIFFLLPGFVFANSIFLLCGEEQSNKIEELNGGPDKLIIIDNLPKGSETGTSSGMVFQTFYAVWESADFWWTPTHISWKKFEHGRPHKGLLDYSISRNNLEGNKFSVGKCFLSTKEELESYSLKVIELNMQINKI